MTGEQAPGDTDDRRGAPEASFDLELAVTAVLAREGDQPALVGMLAEQLAATLGDAVVVQRDGGLLRRKGPVRAVEVVLGPDTYRAEVAHGRVGCSIGHTSGGIRIRSSSVEIDEWVRRLLAALQAEAARSQRTRMALEAIVYGGAA